MGCAAATARRRRKQAVGGYRHLPARERPNYKVQSKEVSERRDAREREKRILMQGRKRKGR